MAAIPPQVLYAFVALGASILVGFVGHLVFRRYRVSDVLVLLGAGIAAGSFFSVFDATSAGPIFAVLAPLGMCLILFEGGLELTWRDLRHVAPRALGAALGTWVITASALFVVAHLLLGLASPIALLLAVALAGPGVTAILPLLPELGLPPSTRAFVTIETTLGSLLNGASSAAVVAVLLAQASPMGGAGIIATTFVVGAAVGLLAGIVWARVLHKTPATTHGYALTIAALLVAYVIAETLHGSGFLAALVFGIVVGNARTLEEEGRVRSLATLSPSSRIHNNEAIFVFRSVYFVYLGALVAPFLGDARYALGALAIVGAILLVRLVTMGAWDLGAKGTPSTQILSIAFAPRGLATAIGASIPVTMGLAGAAEMLPYVVYTILFANAVTSVGMIAYERSRAGSVARVAPATGASDAQ